MKFIIIGMPAAGKTTAYQKIQSILPNSSLISSDEIMRKKMSAKDEIFRNFIKENNLIFTESDETEYDKAKSKSVFFTSKYGDAKFKDLEAKYVQSIVNNMDDNTLCDLGGKAPLHPEINKILTKDSKINVIYLNPSKKRMNKNLIKDYDEGRIRSNYLLEIQKHEKDKEQPLSKEEKIEILKSYHEKIKEERDPKYSDLANHIIHYNTFSPEEIAKIILQINNLPVKSPLKMKECAPCRPINSKEIQRMFF